MKTTTSFQVYGKSGYIGDKEYKPVMPMYPREVEEEEKLLNNAEDDPNNDFGLYPIEVYKEYEKKQKKGEANKKVEGLYPPGVI